MLVYREPKKNSAAATKERNEVRKELVARIGKSCLLGKSFK